MKITPSLCIIVHVWAKPLTQYAEMLWWQWQSFMMFPPKYPVHYWVCYGPSDVATRQVIEEIWDSRPQSFQVNFLPLCFPHRMLFRRAIGRNNISLATCASTVWHADVDYLFGPNCIDSAVELVTPDLGLCYPRSYWIHKDHSTGDRMLADRSVGFNPTADFVHRDRTPAIGGIQIVGGNFAREHGYCKGTKWLNPVDPDRGFACYRDDVAFRRQCGNRGTPVDIVSLYRIRHSQNGRDFGLDGNKKQPNAPSDPV